MGNSVMKYFIGKDRTVSLILLSGEIVEFKEPVDAATVIKRYPEHVVLHCLTVIRGRKPFRRIYVLRPEQTLKRNQSYLITPIQTVGNRKRLQKSWSSLIISAIKKLDARIKHEAERGSPNKTSWFQTIFDKIFRFPNSYRRMEEGDSTAPLLGCNQVSPTLRGSCNRLKNWRPSLACIPESHAVDIFFG